ncbi:MAG: hypothetical protein RMK29_16525 [Myxococcales bacterium]|nr:hypothetical protein [Myxococcota bacterium]MDW8283319.1 hypothetical protein [Myxococcales bacterium]
MERELESAAHALRAGDFGGARRMLLRLRREARSAEERSAIDAELARLQPDPLALVLLGSALLIFAGIVMLTR